MHYNDIGMMLHFSVLTQIFVSIILEMARVTLSTFLSNIAWIALSPICAVYNAPHH